jgi:hypothetical protein
MSEEDNLILQGSPVAALMSGSCASRHFSTEGDQILLRVVVCQPAKHGSSASKTLYCATWQEPLQTKSIGDQNLTQPINHHGFEDHRQAFLFSGHCLFCYLSLGFMVASFSFKFSFSNPTWNVRTCNQILYYLPETQHQFYAYENNFELILRSWLTPDTQGTRTYST